VRYLILVLALTLPGCALFQPAQPLAVPSNLSDAAKEATKLISEAKIVLIALNNTIATQVSGGLMLKSDAQALAKTVDEYWIKVKQAESLLAGGNDLLAKDQARLLSTLLIELQKQVVARSKK
jgi:hypothetical protein